MGAWASVMGRHRLNHFLQNCDLVSVSHRIMGMHSWMDSPKYPAGDLQLSLISDVSSQSKHHLVAYALGLPKMELPDCVWFVSCLLGSQVIQNGWLASKAEWAKEHPQILQADLEPVITRWKGEGSLGYGAAITNNLWALGRYVAVFNTNSLSQVE